MEGVLLVITLFLTVFAVGGITYFFSERIKVHSKYIGTFSAAVVAALIFVHILPEVYEAPSKWIGFTLLAGLIFQLIIEKITNGVEHGHHHSHSKNHRSILIGLFLGLGIHALIEGAPLLLDISTHTHNHAHHHHNESGGGIMNQPYFSAIFFHKIPVTLVLSMFLLSIGVKKGKFFGLLLIFAIATPLGAFLGKQLQSLANFDTYAFFLQAFSTGMLLHIITAILFEHAHTQKEMNRHIVIIILGITLGTLLF